MAYDDMKFIDGVYIRGRMAVVPGAPNMFSGDGGMRLLDEVFANGFSGRFACGSCERREAVQAFPVENDPDGALYTLAPLPWDALPSSALAALEHGI